MTRSGWIGGVHERRLSRSLVATQAGLGRQGAAGRCARDRRGVGAGSAGRSGACRSAPGARREAGAEAAAPSAVEAQLPAVEGLTLASDFTAFLKDEVSEALRRKALQKLFADPHFNRMDGLDIYIDDYSLPDPIPPEAMAKLKSAREWLMANESEVEAVEAETAAEADAFALPADRTDAADVPSDATNGEARDETGGERAGPGCADDGATAVGCAACGRGRWWLRHPPARDAGSGQGTRQGGMHAEGGQQREAQASDSAADLGNAALRAANAAVSDKPIESGQKAP
jgi:Protein of unknown function (DUF3306).